MSASTFYFSDELFEIAVAVGCGIGFQQYHSQIVVEVFFCHAVIEGADIFYLAVPTANAPPHPVQINYGVVQFVDLVFICYVKMPEI